MVFSKYDPICLLTLTFSLMIRRPVLALMLTNLTWLEYPSPCHKFEKKKKFPHWNLTEAFRLAGGHPGVSLTITKITPLRSHPLPINWHPVIHTPIHHVSSPSGNNKKNNIFKKYPNNSLKTTNSLRSSFRLTLGQLWEFGKYWWLWIWLDLSGRG